MNVMSIDAAITDQEIYERILDAVLDHRLVPGTRLAEETLGRAFGVSRTRIRPVLARLAGEQIVVLALNRGATVASPTPQEAREVFGARRLIEPTLTEECAQRATAADHAALASLIEAEEQARASGQRHAEIRATGEFHLRIAACSGNATLEKVLRELVSRTSLIIMTYGHSHAPQPRSSCSSTEHRALLDAIVAHDQGKAVRLMKRHLAHIEAHLDFTQHAEPPTDLVAVLAGR